MSQKKKPAPLEGWDAVEAAQNAGRVLSGEEKRIAQLFAEAFVRNKAGAEVLEILRRKTLFRPAFTLPGMTASESGIWKNARDNFVREILAEIEKAKGV